MAHLLGGRWQRTGKTLGQGGQAVVQIVTDVTGALDGAFAAKVLLNPARKARFVREIRLTTKLHDLGAPVLAIVEDSVQTDADTDKPWYVAPVAPQQSLRHHMTEGAPFGDSVAAALKQFADVAKATRALHKHRVAHRDLKPENVLLFDSRLVLADLGLCLDLGDDPADRVSAESERIGSLHYMPKEAFSRQEIDERQFALDAYALGKVLYELVTGRRLLGFSTPADRGYEIPSTLDPVLRAGLTRTLRGLLHDTPDYRLPILEEIESQAGELITLAARSGTTVSERHVDFADVGSRLDQLIAPPLPPATTEDKDETESLARMVGELWTNSADIEQIRSQLVRGREAHLVLTSIPQQAQMRQLLTAPFTRTRQGMEPLEDQGYPRRPVSESGQAVGLQPQGDLKKKVPELWLCCLVGRSGNQTSAAIAIVERHEVPQPSVDIIKGESHVFTSSAFDAALIKDVSDQATASARRFADAVADALRHSSR